MSKKVWIESLGCAKNLVDSEVMLGFLNRDGLSLAETLEEAELIIVNTCGFIESASEESIEVILDRLAVRGYVTNHCSGLQNCAVLDRRGRSSCRANLPSHLSAGYRHFTVGL